MRLKPVLFLACVIVLGHASDAWSLTGWYYWSRPATPTYTRAPTFTPTLTPVPTQTPTFTPPVAPADAFQIRYAANLNVGDSVVNLSNAGTQAADHPAGNICANVYVFDPDEEMISCCSCLVTPNALNSLSARNDLIGNTLTPGVPNSIVVKLLATTPIGGTCNPSSPTASNLAPGLRAWGTTPHALPTTPITYATTETPFSPAVLSASELNRLSSFCGFIQGDASGFGICKSCRPGGL